MTPKRIAIPIVMVLAAIAALLFSNNSPLAAQENVATAGKGHLLATPDTTEKYAPGSLLVKFKTSTKSADQSTLLSSLGATVKEVLPLGGISLLTVPEGAELTSAAALVSNGAVEFAEPDYYKHVDAIPNDTYYAGYQWGMANINAPVAWDRPQTPGVTLGIIDTGLDYNHPEFAGRAAPGGGRTAVSGRCGVAVSPQDDEGHGTHVAGIASAGANNGIGVAGVSWNATILPFKALNSEGRGCTSDIIYGLDWLLDRGAKVVNMSLGSATPSNSESAAMADAWARGALVVASSGNSGPEDPADCGDLNYPASYNFVLSVAATGITNNRAYYSNCNNFVDIAAPGGDARNSNDPDNRWIISTWPLNISGSYPAVGYAELIGTSMAAPHVAGAAALLLAISPGLSNVDLDRILTTSATDLGAPGRDVQFGTGLLNLAAAVAQLAPPAAPTNTPLPTNTPQPTATPTITPIPATPTIGPGCLFSDVCQADYFFTPVQYLVNHGAVSGYGDNTFRPYANATRGQLSKILVVGYGWPIHTMGGPHFSDVPTTNAFYGFVETALFHSVISGYADGTFRLNALLTRSQLAKIIVVAENWPINTTGGPHFRDVPASNAFYGVIETARFHGAISGYADGTFRPGASATRGQIAKIIYGAITTK